MPDSEKMEALKGAYAQLILNTSKEAAARLMDAEIRSRRLEQNLVSTKEEAARMLLRLKRMIDAKIEAAEIKSFDQQRKVDELECQLNEAEGIILDLRAELSQTQDQLDKLRKENMVRATEHENARLHNIKPNDAHSARKSCIDWSIADQTGYNPSNPSVNFNSGRDVYSDNHPVLDEIKDPKLFRNGCTGSDCSAEKGLTQGKFAVGDKSNPCNNSINIPVATSAASSESEEKVSALRRSRRKRKLKFWDDVIAACGLRRPSKFKKPRPSCPHILGSGTSKPEENDTEHIKDLSGNTELNKDCDVNSVDAAKACKLRDADGEKLFKYTFSRKWKKKSSICPEKSSSYEESVLQNEIDDTEFQNSNLAELCTNSDQLEQVAQQLVTLSGRCNDTPLSGDEI